MSRERLEAFSDGVFAIAITLLILNLAVPDFAALGRQGLAGDLARQWPSFAALAVSFLTIGIIWVNHHYVFAEVVEVDRVLLFLNLFLLGSVVFMPYPTALMAHAFEAGREQSLATAIYGATSAAMGAGFGLTWAHLGRRRHLLREPLRSVGVGQVLSRASVGFVIYLATIGLAFINPYVCLAVYAGLALFYAIVDVRNLGPHTGAHAGEAERDQPSTPRDPPS